jgi:predicted transcriptional regulator
VSEHEEEAARRLAEELRNLKVDDLVQISSIGYRRLGLTEETKDDRDLSQAKLAIDTMKALTPVLAQVVPSELVLEFERSVAELQLAYVKAASEEGGGQG